MLEQSEKDKFYRWIHVKIRLSEVNRMPKINKGEIWWAAVGKNIGAEINGKSETFARPVLIFKKFSRETFLAIPLASQPHHGSWYVEVHFSHRISQIILSQIRVMSVSRLYKRIGVVPDVDFEMAKMKFEKLFLSK